MQLDVTFGVLDYGPFHPAKSVTTTSWNGMQLQITTENSDYSDQGERRRTRAAGTITRHGPDNHEGDPPVLRSRGRTAGRIRLVHLFVSCSPVRRPRHRACESSNRLPAPGISRAHQDSGPGGCGFGCPLDQSVRLRGSGSERYRRTSGLGVGRYCERMDALPCLIEAPVALATGQLSPDSSSTPSTVVRLLSRPTSTGARSAPRPAPSSQRFPPRAHPVPPRSASTSRCLNRSTTGFSPISSRSFPATTE